MPFSGRMHVFLQRRRPGVKLWVYFGGDGQCPNAAVPFISLPATRRCSSGLPDLLFFFFIFFTLLKYWVYFSCIQIFSLSSSLRHCSECLGWLIVNLICIPFMSNKGEHLFMCLLAICIVSVMYLFGSFEGSRFLSACSLEIFLK